MKHLRLTAILVVLAGSGFLSMAFQADHASATGSSVSGSGTTGRIPKFIGASCVENSILREQEFGTGTNMGVGSVHRLVKLLVAGGRFAVNGMEDGPFGILIANQNGPGPIVTFSKDSGTDIKFTIDNNGNVGIGTTMPERKLHLNEGAFHISKLSSVREVDFDIGVACGDGAIEFNVQNDTNALRISTDADNGRKGYVGFGSGVIPIHPIHMRSGAHCTAGGTWTNASSRELKDNIRDLSLDEAIDSLGNLAPKKFTYKADKTEEYVGFIAEEVPDLVATKDRKGLASMDIVGVLTKVVQAQQEELGLLKIRLASLEKSHISE